MLQPAEAGARCLSVLQVSETLRKRDSGRDVFLTIFKVFLEWTINLYRTLINYLWTVASHLTSKTGIGFSRSIIKYLKKFYEDFICLSTL